jgi:type IV pilus assembly protein PilE
MRGLSGFTLIEVMVVVAIVAILSAIAVPAYTRYIQRGDLVEGTQALSQYRVQMEQYYQDNGKYSDTAGTSCGIGAPTLVYFTLACVLNTAQAYTATASGKAGSQIAGVAYKIDQGANQWTTAVPAGWTLTTAASTSWIVR